MSYEKPQSDPKLENIQAFLSNNEAWGINPYLTYGLTDSTIRMELHNVKLLFSKTVIVEQGKLAVEEVRSHIDNPAADQVPDIINFASITKPFFSAALIKFLQSHRVDLNSYTIDLTQAQISKLSEELAQTKYDSIRTELTLSLNQGQLDLSMLLKLANKYSSNEATTIIKQELTKLTNGDELSIEQYIQTQLGMPSFQMNRAPGIWELGRANSGSIVEAAVAFDELTHYGYRFLDDMQENDVNFKFDISGSTIREEIVSCTGIKVKNIWEKTGFFPQVRWGKELSLPENGLQPVHMIMISLFTIELEDGQRITGAQYFLAGRPMVDDVKDANQKHTDLKRVDLFNDHLRAQSAGDFREQAINTIVDYLQSK